MLKLSFMVILLSAVAQIKTENLPTFIWGSKSSGHFPALNSLSGDEFTTFVKSQIDKDTLTIVFVENSLSVEDLSQCRVADSSSCFGNLQKLQKKTYLTSVVDPVKALQSSFDEKQQKSVSLTNDDDLNSKLDGFANEKFVFVYLDDVDGKEDFVKHDEQISKLYNLIASKRENVIAIYTGRHPSFMYSKPLIRKARDTAGKQDPAPPTAAEVKFFKSDNALVALSGIQVADSAVDITGLAVTTNFSADDKKVDVLLTAGSHQIKFEIVLSGGSWGALTITYSKDSGEFKRYIPVSPVDAYEERSFGCGNLTLSNAIQYISLTDFQLQPHFNAEPIGDAFAKGHNDCVGFFSSVIWGIIFVVILLLLILSYGFMMIMDINTMDRFDDPKGKTIIVNAQE